MYCTSISVYVYIYTYSCLINLPPSKLIVIIDRRLSVCLFYDHWPKFYTNRQKTLPQRQILSTSRIETINFWV